MQHTTGAMMPLKIHLMESPTILLFAIDGDCLITESSVIPEENAIEFVDLIPNTHGRSKCTQTIQPLEINEQEQTNPIDKKDEIIQATEWDLYDSFQAKKQGAAGASSASAPSGELTKSQASPLEALECSLACSSIVHSWAEMVDVPWPRDPLHRKEIEEPFNLKLAWKMDWNASDESIKINCITSNPQDKMLFVVTCENLNSHQGLITCWNIKNVVQPEMTIYTSNNPTQSRFSTKFPRLFATGFQSGQVQIVSIDSKLTQLPPDQIDNNGHEGSVWDLCWMDDKILSTGSDGRVLLWTFSKTSFSSKVVAELGPTFYHVELPRELKESCDMVECLPTPASRCCVPLNQDDGVGRFIVGSDDGSLHTFSILQHNISLGTKKRHVGSVIHVEVVSFQDQQVLISLGNDNFIFMEYIGSGRVQRLFPEPRGTLVNFNCSTDHPELLAVVKPDSLELWRIFPAPLLLSSIRHMFAGSSKRSTKLTTITFVNKSKAILVGDSIGKLYFYSFSHDTNMKFN